MIPALETGAEAEALLAAHALDRAALEPMPGDASSRRYFRARGRGLLLMEERSDPVGFDAYLRVSRHLRALGLSAPEVVGAEPRAGLALIEDFGDLTYTACLARGDDEAALYALAVDVLLALHGEARAAEIAQPPYTVARLLDELDIFADWFAPAVAPDGADLAAFKAEARALWAAALAPVATAPRTLVLRDFHVDNLMLLEGREGVARCGLLDFQDAVIGPPEYDLVSLLQDARRDLAPGLEADCLARYLAAAPEAQGTEAEIRHRYHLLGAQRHARILGVFVRLDRHFGKPRYLGFLPRVVSQLETALREAGLDEIAALLDRALPGWAERGRALATPSPERSRR